MGIINAPERSVTPQYMRKLLDQYLRRHKACLNPQSSLPLNTLLSGHSPVDALSLPTPSPFVITMITLSSIGLLALTMSARASFLRQCQCPALPFSPITDWTVFNCTAAQLISERADPIASPGKVAQHTHFVTGGSNFGVEIPSSDYLRQSECTSTGIQEDKSAYWFPQMYFEHANGSFEFVSGGPVIYYLYPDQAGMTTPFPDDFVMITGNTAVPPPYGSAMQKAVSFLCLNFNGVSVRYDYLPADVQCQDGIRAQIVSHYTRLPHRLSHL